MAQLPLLKTLPAGQSHQFIKPIKRINEVQDVPMFLMSKAYCDVTTFLAQLNRAMFPNKTPAIDMAATNTPEAVSPISNLTKMVLAIDKLIDEVPLDPGSHRFGNTAFRKWHQLLESQIKSLLEQHLTTTVLNYPHEGAVLAVDELQAYLLGSFGSAQRIDYGTGHELSFLAFLAGIWKLGAFELEGHDKEKRIVLEIIQPYLLLVRKLIQKYSLEPAGSHGVWGLDDHSFLPYIFGSAQYGPSITNTDPTPVEGSVAGAPDPGDIVKPAVVQRERGKNLYFEAIGFILDIKKGPFWEHSRTLYNISGVRAGWAKINKGMIKMYDGEVLSKFPVVQHFTFGSLFSFEQDPDPRIPVSMVHTTGLLRKNMPISDASQDIQLTSAPQAKSNPGSVETPPTALTTMPARTSASDISDDLPRTRAPWAK